MAPPIPATRLLSWRHHVDALVQDCNNSSALAMELLQSCTKPSMWCPSIAVFTIIILTTARVAGFIWRQWATCSLTNMWTTICVCQSKYRDVTEQQDDFKITWDNLWNSKKNVLLLALKISKLWFAVWLNWILVFSGKVNIKLWVIFGLYIPVTLRYVIVISVTLYSCPKKYNDMKLENSVFISMLNLTLEFKYCALFSRYPYARDNLEDPRYVTYTGNKLYSNGP